MNRREQYKKFQHMTVQLLLFCEYWEIPVRDGEAHRPRMVAEDYQRRGVGILNSKHRKSLAKDWWIIHIRDATDITWIPTARVIDYKGKQTGTRPLTDAEIDQQDISHASRERIKQAKKWLEMMGASWEKQGGTWGGNFKKYDPYHFEIKGPVAKS